MTLSELNTLVPGISGYPDLARQLEWALSAQQKTCTPCDRTNIIQRFAALVAQYQREAKHLVRPTGRRP